MLLVCLVKLFCGASEEAVKESLTVGQDESKVSRDCQRFDDLVGPVEVHVDPFVGLLVLQELLPELLPTSEKGLVVNKKYFWIFSFPLC